MSEISSEQLKTQNVFEINPERIIDPFERKAVLAMQATGLFVHDDGAFEDAYEELLRAAEIAGKPATMTYEDVVFRNTLPGGIEGNYFSGVRVLSADPEVAVAEAEFYRAHRIIEGKLYRAIAELLFLNTNPELFGTGPYKIRPFSGESRPDETSPGKSLDGVLDIVQELPQRVGRDEFNSFRPYFVGLNGYPGASGLYSESIPILDLLVHGGSNISDEERDAMRDNLDRGLYPNHEGHSVLLRDLLDKVSPEIELPDSVRQGLTRQLDTFRRHHMRAVRKFVPGAMEGMADGSGGVTDVAGYLASKMVNIKGAKADAAD